MSPDRISVSAVIPAFNEATRIGAAIESVLAQSLPAREIIVVDDGSTDDTAAIAGRYGVRVVRQSNAGISAARNRAFAEASGDWLALLDADDLWLPDRLEWLGRATAAHPDIHFGFSDYTVDENGLPNAPSNLARTPQYCSARGFVRDGAIYAIKREALCESLAVGNFLGTSTVFVRRAIVLEHDLRFDESLPLRTADYQLSEDVEWYLRVLKWTDALAIERVLARYLRRPGSQAANHGQVRYGDFKLGERVVANSEAYGPGSAAAFRSMRRPHLIHAAWIHIRAGEFSFARARLEQAQHDRFVAMDAFWLAVATIFDCAVGRSTILAMRSVWHRGLRPIVRSFTRPQRR